MIPTKYISIPKLISIILTLLILAYIISCDTKKKQIDTSANITPATVHEVTIYGSENCDHCLEFRHKMDSAKFTYEFKDAEASEQYYYELLKKIQLAKFDGYVSFPVLDIDGEIYVKPDFNDIVKLLEK